MKRITEISQLTKGDVIVTIADYKIVKREFVCVHPHNDKYSIFLNELQDGCPKFYNENLKLKEWYLFTNSKEEWKELYDMVVEELKNSIAFYEQRSKEIRL
ncbi:hypothetical protein [Prevotella melaninogenica]|uniref:hypothetical protein n=1 Tax=Prevotella melaninogenica TaxID=28132 RepID=UPI001BAD7420|nr:hypothetical protein [Prevotella melaninogenica]QUB66054.1 hypothetical protein J5A57_02870 [Prevotella melaninogenica]